MRLLQGPLAALMCGILVLPSPAAFAQTGDSSTPSPTAKHHARTAYQSNELQGDARILHALNRLTFGPRPGDLEAVRALGLEAWFEQQLNPEAIQETDLNARLAQYPAMQWSTQELLYRLPSNAIIRQAINGKIGVPGSGIVHAIYEDQIARVEARKEAKQQKEATAEKPAMNAAEPAMTAAGQSAAEVALSQTADAESLTAKPGDAKSMEMGSADPVAPAVSDEEIRSVLELEPGPRVSRLAAMPQPELDAFYKTLRPLQRLALVADMTPDEREMVAALEGPERLVAEEVIAERLTRDIYSNAQLQEVMTDFWLNHFNIYLRKDGNMPYELASYARDVIRAHALGKFEDLLEATAHSPAMMLYLDNASSVGPDSIAVDRVKRASFRRPELAKRAPEGLNENYARELMELQTIGVNGGYTQADVTQVARIFTGWTVDRPDQGASFVFNPNRHEPGTKTVMGVKYKEDGEREGEEFLHALASSPAAAQFLSRELAVRFVSDDPPQSLVDRMAQSYLSTGGDIREVLRTMFHSPEFWSKQVYRAKVKTPLEYVVSAVRASNADIENLRPLANALHQMGMPLYGCIPPTGYDWNAPTWVNTGALVDRMNFALSFAANRLPGIYVEWSAAEDNSAGSMISTGTPAPEAEESRLEASLLVGGVSQTTRSAVLQQFEKQFTQTDNAQSRPVADGMKPWQGKGAVTPTERQDELLAGLLLGSPEFQRR
jgi:uncharacterized protein (DUF1800 family)